MTPLLTPLSEACLAQSSVNPTPTDRPSASLHPPPPCHTSAQCIVSLATRRSQALSQNKFPGFVPYPSQALSPNTNTTYQALKLTTTICVYATHSCGLSVRSACSLLMRSSVEGAHACRLQPPFSSSSPVCTAKYTVYVRKSNVKKLSKCYDGDG